MLTDHLIDVQVERCELARWSGERDRCRWCDEPVRNGSSWCSLTCTDRYEAEHEWVHARSAALARDHECCLDCGTGPAAIATARALIRALIPMDPMTSAQLWRSEEWLSVQLACSVDVVHRMPPAQGYRSGCHHHLDGLVTLCRRCQDRARMTIDLRTA